MNQTPRPTDAARVAHALARSRAVVTRYLAEHPESILQSKVASGTLSPAEVYSVLTEVSRDPKTGVDRADLLSLTLGYEIEGANRYGWALSVVIADIDDFKQINTELTHVGADDVLRRVATTLHDGVRDSDDVLPGHGSVVRWGGEEFVVVLVGADEPGAVIVAERLRQQVQTACADLRPGNKPITVSFGVAAWNPTTMKSWTDLLKLADERLFQAKRTGKNRVVGEIKAA